MIDSPAENGFKKSQNDTNDHGIIIIQIDGLSRPQLEKAIKNGTMPFVNSIISRKQHTLHSFYSGLPSSTPAVQAELFYGVKCAVPSFGFLDRTTRHLCTMLQSHVVNKMESAFEAVKTCLLKGGSAYSDIYKGGASNAHFCVTGSGMEPLTYLKKIVHPLGILAHCMMIPRLLYLAFMELIIATVDFVKGVIGRENFFTEILFIPARVGICVLLRELIVYGICIDIEKKYPLIHCNFLGYDEQAHRRGPSSRFAHWTLKGIDNAIKHIAVSSIKSNGINYELWIYSDHGQESTQIYVNQYGLSIREAITKVTGLNVTHLIDQPMQDNGIQLERIRLLGHKRHTTTNLSTSHNHECSLSAVGPLGHLYIHYPITDKQKHTIALQLVKYASVPSVYFINKADKVVFVSENRTVLLEKCDIKLFAGNDHAFANEIISDLEQLVRHPDAGELVLSGWCNGKPPLSFPFENGSHGGPGPLETHGFLIIPPNVPVDSTKPYFRPVDFRALILERIEVNS